MSNFWQQAAKDAEAILTDQNGFGSSLTFTTPVGFDPAATATITGMPVVHSTRWNPDTGTMVVSKTARVTVMEKSLEDVEYPTRDTDGRLALTNHKVAFVDVRGTTYTGIVREQIPNGRIGILVLTLGDVR